MIVKITLKKKKKKTNLLEPISKTLNAPLVQIIVYPTDTKVIVEYLDEARKTILDLLQTPDGNSPLGK